MKVRPLLPHITWCTTAITLAFLCSTIRAQQQPDAYGVFEVGNGVTPPKPVSTPNPEYTDKARKKRISGTVMVRMTVTSEGVVRDATVTKSLDKELDQQALKAVRMWTFKPATKDGQPVAVHVNADVSFDLR